MGLNHTGELLVRMQALPFEAVFPTSEEGASAAFGAVIPELPEGLLQNIGGVQAPVGLEQLFECAATVVARSNFCSLGSSPSSVTTTK